MVVIIGMRCKPEAEEVSVSCNSLRRAVYSPREVVPGSQDPGSGRLHRLLGWVCVWIVTCACTQDSWWLQQQC